MGRPRLPDPEKFCEWCGVRLERKRYKGNLEDRPRFRQRKFCSRSCANSRKNPTLGGLRTRAQKFRGQQCETCGTDQQLHIHHVDHDPSNNAPQNLQTLCASCHLKLHWQTRERKPTQPCKYCEQPSRKRGMCQKHYQRFRKYGSAFVVKKGNGFGTWLEYVS